MKNKNLLFIIFISIFLILILTYFTYYKKNIIIKNFTDHEKVEVFNDYKEKGLDVCYGNRLSCKKIKYKRSGEVNTSKLGNYKITYEITYKDKTLIKNKIVEVSDSKAPELKIEGTHDNVCPNGKTDKVTFSAVDNYDGDITDKIKYKLENNRIIYKVTDSSGNETKKEFDVTIYDNEKPVLILAGDQTVYLGLGNDYKEDGYTAIDNCDGNITNNVEVKGKVDINKAGTYELIYSVKDSFNNITEASRTIKVFPKNNYVPGQISPKTIYLTFDDGPGPYTEKLLNILNTYNAKATFFVIGTNTRYDYLITKEHEQGHTVGLHSFTHVYSNIYRSVDSYMNDLLMLRDKVKNLTGTESRIIRFPGGSSNTVSKKYKVGIMNELTKKVEEIGFRYFDWNIMSGDAGNTKDPNKIVQNVISGIKPNNINVVLMHDIKPYTIEAVPRIIEYGLANGYTFAPLTMESPVVHQKVNN